MWSETDNGPGQPKNPQCWYGSAIRLTKTLTEYAFGNRENFYPLFTDRTHGVISPSGHGFCYSWHTKTKPYDAVKQFYFLWLGKNGVFGHNPPHHDAICHWWWITASLLINCYTHNSLIQNTLCILNLENESAAAELVHEAADRSKFVLIINHQQTKTWSVVEKVSPSSRRLF